MGSTATILEDRTFTWKDVCERGIRTRRGVKAPDVTWTSAARAAERAGEICVEVLSAATSTMCPSFPAKVSID